MQKKWASLGGMYSIECAAVEQSFLWLSSDTGVFLYLFCYSICSLKLLFSSLSQDLSLEHDLMVKTMMRYGDRKM